MHFLSKQKPLLIFLIPIFLVLLAIGIVFGLHTVAPTDTESYRTSLLEKMEHASSFPEFTNALFCYEVTSDSITTSYTLKNPSAYQIPELTPRLSSFSYGEYNQSHQKQSEQKLLSLLSDTLKSFDTSSLKKQEQITYSLLEKNFSLNEQLGKYAYYDQQLGSTTGVQANLPVTLGEYPLHSEADVKTYLALLTQIPDYFNEVISYEKHRTTLGWNTPDFLLNDSKDSLTTLLESLKKEDNCFVETFDERIVKIDSLSKKKITSYQKQNHDYVNKYVLPAYQKLYDYITATLSARESKNTSSQGYIPDLNTPYGLSSLPKGKDYYSLLVQCNTGSAKSVPQLISLTEQTLKQTLGDVLNIALTDQKAYLYYCDNPIDTYYESPEAILEALSLMIRQDYPVLKEPPSYCVKSVPDSLATSLSPAFYMIPAIDNYNDNTIYINSLYTNTEKGNLFTTLAHEGFPGHLYQTVYFNEQNPEPLRHILNYPGYVEGWATYVELNAFDFLEYPLEGDSLCRLYQAETIISLALSSRIDLGVNYENWTLSDVNAFFEENGFNSYYAADVYSYVVEAPATYLPYFI